MTIAKSPVDNSDDDEKSNDLVHLNPLLVFYFSNYTNNLLKVYIKILDLEVL